MSEKIWKVGDEVMLSHSAYCGCSVVDWEELGIIDSIDADEGIAWVMVRDGEEIDVPLSELIAY